MVNECDKILVLEEGYPIVEDMLKGYQGAGTPITGRLDGALPRDGELNPNLVATTTSFLKGTIASPTTSSFV